MGKIKKYFIFINLNLYKRYIGVGLDKYPDYKSDKYDNPDKIAKVF